jgi:hypothetical protein
VSELTPRGDLKHGDEAAMLTILDSAMAAVDGIRYSVFAPRRFHRKLKLKIKRLPQHHQCALRPAVPEPLRARLARRAHAADRRAR